MKLVVSTMKNEGPFLLEWLAYHKAIGFDAFLIYSNDCTDGTDHMLDRLMELGEVEHRRNKVLKRGPHKSALKYALDEPILKQAEWVYVADADEFLNIKIGNGHVDDLIAAYPGADVIPVTWRMFSSGGAVDFPIGSVLRTFTDAEPEVPHEQDRLRFVKSLFRPDDRIQKLGLHAPDYGDDAAVKWGSPYLEAEPEGEPRRPSGQYGYDVAQVNHYAVRSIDAFLLKRDRGRANHVHHKLDASYWLRWNRGGVEDKSIQRFVRPVRKRHAALRQDEKLAFLEDASIALSEKRLGELKQEKDFAALRAALTSATPAEEVSSVWSANAKMKIKSPRRHKNRQAVLGMMPKGGRCAEIGVWQGGFTIEILEITNPKELVLIDPWGLLAEQSEEEWVHSKNNDRSFMDRMYDDVVQEFGHKEPVQIRKGFSEQVLSEYPDDYFDWVYIDGNHLYEFVKSDVELCFRKVRPGGIIAGDDFLWEREGRKHVKDGVHDAMKGLGLDPDAHLKLKGQQFMIAVER